MQISFKHYILTYYYQWIHWYVSNLLYMMC